MIFLFFILNRFLYFSSLIGRLLVHSLADPRPIPLHPLGLAAVQCYRAILNRYNVRQFHSEIDSLTFQNEQLRNEIDSLTAQNEQLRDQSDHWRLEFNRIRLLHQRVSRSLVTRDRRINTLRVQVGELQGLINDLTEELELSERRLEQARTVPIRRPHPSLSIVPLPEGLVPVVDTIPGFLTCPICYSNTSNVSSIS